MSEVLRLVFTVTKLTYFYFYTTPDEHKVKLTVSVVKIIKVMEFFAPIFMEIYAQKC